MKLYLITCFSSFSNQKEVLTMGIKADNASYDIELGFSASKFLNGPWSENIVVLSEFEKNAVLSFIENKDHLGEYIKHNDAKEWKKIFSYGDVKMEEITLNLAPTDTFAKAIVDIQSKS